MQFGTLGITVSAAVIAAVGEQTATAAAIAMIGASALLALKIGLVTGTQVARGALQDVQARMRQAEDSAALIGGRLDVLEDRQRSETVFDLRAEKAIADLASMQFELARIGEQLAIIEQQLGVPAWTEAGSGVSRSPNP